MTQEITTFEDAFDRLAAGLMTSGKASVGSFHEFLVNIWSQSFDNPEYFKAWHVGVVAEDIEKCLQDG